MSPGGPTRNPGPIRQVGYPKGLAPQPSRLDQKGVRRIRPLGGRQLPFRGRLGLLNVGPGRSRFYLRVCQKGGTAAGEDDAPRTKTNAEGWRDRLIDVILPAAYSEEKCER